MKLLEAEPQLAPPQPGDAPTDPPTEVATPPARSCPTCGAPLAGEQDWCLSCGTAATSLLARRPGWRAAVTVAVAAMVLLAGAAAASYAALTDDPPPGASPVAQVPAPTPTAPAPTEPTPTPAAPTDTTTAPTETTPSESSELPTVSTPTTPTVPTPTPRRVTPTTPSSTPGEGEGPTTTPGPTGEVPPSDDAPTTPTPGGSPSTASLTPIALEPVAGAVYDPYGRGTATGDPGRALDENATTSWFVDPKDPTLLGVGYTIDLGRMQAVKALELVTKTPGFRVEVYASDQTELPPDILDTRWTHVRDVSDVGVDDPDDPDDVAGSEQVALATGTTKYRHVLLWFTQPPTAGPRLRITELKLFR